MDKKLLALCEREFEIGVKMLCDALENSVVDGESWLREVPFIGGLYVAGLDPDYPLLPPVCAALRAREQFRQDAPSWTYQPLPLRAEVCDELVNADNTRLQVVGLYGYSWRCTDWDRKHPTFRRFCSGLLAYEHTPDRLRDDRELRREFPPRPLKGLCDGELYWRSDATIVWDRQYRAWCAGTGPAPVRL